MRQLLLAFLMLFALPSWAETRDPTTHFFQPKFGDFRAELATAKQQGKKGIFLFFEMDDCPFCARMKSTRRSSSCSASLGSQMCQCSWTRPFSSSGSA